MIRGGWFTPLIVGWNGKGEPGPRTIDRKRKARDRRHRKLVRLQRRTMR